MTIDAVHFAGTRAVLVELSDAASAMALTAWLESHPLPGQQDVQTGARTVLLRTDCLPNAGYAYRLIPTLHLDLDRRHEGELITVNVSYDGPDLHAVAELLGLSTEALIELHSSRRWAAAFTGFAPGFAYLQSEGTPLEVPRRSTPRTTVPAGAVALGGKYSAIYPAASPGGWQLLGHTDTRMWDVNRTPPALVQPGDKVKFVPQRAALRLSVPAANHQPPAPQVTSGVEVISPGPQSTIQDAGRRGAGNLGVSPSGAADAISAHQANRLVGNLPGAPVIETLAGSLRVRAIGHQVLAVSGAEVRLEIHGEAEDHTSMRTAAMNVPFILRDKETLSCSAATAGLRSYLAVRGGFDGHRVLGSLSTDSLSGLGPAPLQPGERLPTARIRGTHPVGGAEPSTLPQPEPDGCFRLRLVAGPRDDWFGPQGLKRLVSQTWEVSAQSNRVGMRLSNAAGGRPLVRLRAGELESEGMVRGSLQVPPSGLPVLFLADHPVTGGYPVIATLVDEDVSKAAQLAPGTPIRFVLLEPGSSMPRTGGGRG
ncbi:urea amidolyase family protein [Glutamicibacter sp. V16R2B1]|uniref:5-oxoprolinase subunit B/C family protein n=1 Tax=Glutamicibacter sp. V16R2B1 TaxID=2036207 RepID=UPI0010FF0666|nr:urea amidolyase family protein [Glutamicibacter sp. V16R2B1]TLK56767.1 5-oxoprolinase/urea amidolyase family protein [Glutamicibacter sp. V16R2B1]